MLQIISEYDKDSKENDFSHQRVPGLTTEDNIKCPETFRLVQVGENDMADSLRNNEKAVNKKRIGQ